MREPETIGMPVVKCGDGPKRGGRSNSRKRTQEESTGGHGAVAARTVKMSREVAPFCGEVKERVEEWLEDHMVGDKAAATEKAYGSMWQN